MRKRVVLKESGHSKLWLWFGLSRSSFCVLPRVLMHEMPDEWQRKMAELLNEWDAAWNWDDCGFDTPYVNLRKDNRYVKAPHWLKNYRHPDRDVIEKMRARRDD